MATVTFKAGAYPGAGKVHVYDITGLVQGANSITLPTPPAAGSFDVSGNETPTEIRAYPYQHSAFAGTVTPDLDTISNSSGVITFTLYADGSTNARVHVW